MKKRYRSIITKRIWKSVRKLSVLGLGMVFFLGMSQIEKTSSFFTDNVSVTGNTFSTGYWVLPEVPEVLGWNVRSESDSHFELPVDIACGGITNGDFPTEGDGRISFLWEDVDYHEFDVEYEKQWLRPGKNLNNEGDWQGHEVWNTSYSNFRTFGSSAGTEGLWHNRVRALVDTNGDGNSDLISGWSEGCSVVYDRTAPVVEIEKLEDDDKVSGKVVIEGSVIDNNPHHYWLVIQDSNGHTVAGPGVVNENNSLISKNLYSWDTTNFSDGIYEIKLEARDEADNKDAGSFDWIEVEVSNKAEDFVVLNEFVPNPVGDDRALMPGGEWVELYNKGDVDFDVAGWYLYDADDSGILIGEENSDNDGDTGDSGETIVPAKGYLVIYRNKDWHFELNNEGEEELKLYNGEIESGGVLVDFHGYDGSDFDDLTATLLGFNVNDFNGNGKSDVPIGKSFIRYPDGFDNWIDPIPTPGKANDDENSTRELLKYYGEVCFEDGKPVCEEDFMMAIGLLQSEIAINNEQTAINNEQTAINNEQEIVNNEQEIAVNNEQTAISNEQTAISNEETAINNEQTAINNEETAINNEQIAVNNEQTAISNEQTAISNEEIAVNNEQEIINNEPQSELTDGADDEAPEESLMEEEGFQAGEPIEEEVGLEEFADAEVVEGEEEVEEETDSNEIAEEVGDENEDLEEPEELLVEEEANDDEKEEELKEEDSEKKDEKPVDDEED